MDHEIPYHRLYNLPRAWKSTRTRGHIRATGDAVQADPGVGRRFGRVEAVDVGDGVKVDDLNDPPYQDGSHNRSISGSLTSSVSTAAVVFRGEMYDVRKGRKRERMPPLR